MSGLPNLARLIEQELPEITQTMRDGTEIVWCGTVGDTYVGWTPRGDAEANGHPVKRLDQHPALIAAAPALAEQIAQDETAFSEIAEQQQKALAIARANGFVFDDIGSDPGNWQHLAFTYYTMLCEIDSMARAALARLADYDKEIGQ